MSSANCERVAPAKNNHNAFIAVLCLLAAAAVFLAWNQGRTQAGLFIIGGALGLALYHAAFGFTSAWRVLIADRRGSGVRAQMLLLALGVVLFFPVLASGSLFGREVSGAVSPVGVSIFAGAFMFGIGMQLGGGCASGTLYTVGGGNARMLVTLLFFILGSLAATVHFDWWAALPSLPPVSMVNTLGPATGIFVSCGIFAAIALLTIVIEKKRHGSLETSSSAHGEAQSSFIKGPWPLLWGAVALAVLNFLTLAMAGRPWGVTSAFALWGAKWAEMAGLQPSQWAYWQTAGNAKALSSSVLADVTSVMNFGIIAGAMLAATLAGRFAPNLRISLRSLAAAVLGGLLMGYGARIAYGCNIGAYFSGIVSGSLHGWLWLLPAFLGNMAGVWLRPYFFAHKQASPQLAAC